MFEFLEVNENEHREQAVYQEIIKEIPDNQRLSISDLRIINPDIKTLKAITKRILDKYSIVPLYIILPATKPNLPKHLVKEYWGTMQGKKNITLYVAMPNPFDNHVLNILRSITDYSVISLPVIEKDSSLFLNNEYNKIVFNNKPSKEENNKTNDVSNTLKDNISYIIFFIFILVGLILIKFFIGR